MATKSQQISILRNVGIYGLGGPFVLAIAALLTLISGILSGLGHSIQRHSLDSLPELTPRAFYQRHIHLLLAIFTTPLWLLGGILTVGGAVLRWQAISGSDVSLLKPLTNINILVVVIIGVVFLGERIGRAEWVGIAGLLGGVLVLSISIEERVVVSYHIPSYILSMIVCFLLVLIFTFIGSQLNRSTREKELFFALSAGILYGLATIFLKAMTIEVIQILGYFVILDPLVLLILFTRISFWFYLISSIIAFFLLQSAYSHRRASVAFPINNSLSTLVPLILAVFVFGDLLLLPINGHLIFPLSYLRILGIIAIVLGILLLRRFQGKSYPPSPETASPIQSVLEEEVNYLALKDRTSGFMLSAGVGWSTGSTHSSGDVAWSLGTLVLGEPTPVLDCGLLKTYLNAMMHPGSEGRGLLVVLDKGASIGTEIPP